MTDPQALPLGLGEGVLLVDLESPLPDLVATGPFGTLCLVRRAGIPLGSFELMPGEAPLDSAALTRRIENHLGPAFADRAGARARCAADGEGAPRRSTRATVVVATRDRHTELAACLASLRAMRRVPARTIVVDNVPSDDRTEEMVRRLQREDPTLRYVRELVPGLASAHNAALPLVETPLVAFTDDDVIVDPNWLDRIEDAFTSAADVACVTGLIFPTELVTQEQWWLEHNAGFAKGWARRTFDLGPNRPIGDRLFPYTAGAFGSGANMAFTAAFLTDIGGFDPALGAGTGSLGGDDLAALHDVVASGHQLVYEPSAIVFHRHPRDLSQLRRQAFGYGAGLTAYLTRVIVERPAALPAIARRSVAGLRHTFGPLAPLAARRPRDYPRDLVRRERVGMMSGPWRYLRTRRQRRHLARPVPAIGRSTPAAEG